MDELEKLKKEKADIEAEKKLAEEKLAAAEKEKISITAERDGLKESKAKLEAEAVAKEIDSQTEKIVAEGKLMPKNKEDFKKALLLCSKDAREALLKVMDGQKVIDLKQTGAQGSEGSIVKLTAEEMKKMSYAELTKAKAEGKVPDSEIQKVSVSK